MNYYVIIYIGFVCSCQHINPISRDSISSTPRNFGRVAINNLDDVPTKAIKNTTFSKSYSHKQFIKVKKGMAAEQLLNILGEPIYIQTYSKNGEMFHNYTYTDRKKAGDFVEIYVRVSNNRVIDQYEYLNIN